MKRTILTIITLLFFRSDLFCQNTIDSVLMLVEKNNTTLSAFRKNTDADKIGNKTGLYPHNPEAAFNYLWGSPSIIGNRTDFSIKQTFDFPTAYSYKNQISNLKNEQAELEYQRQRKLILLQTHRVCIDLINRNALKSELQKRMDYAVQIANSFKTKFDLGEANIIDYNKARINLLNSTKEVETNEIERSALLSELAGLNGGSLIIFNDIIYPQQTIVSDFEQWYNQAEQNNPVLQWIKLEIAITQKQKQLNTALSLPRFDAGYMSEKVAGEQFQGIALGISIPLWENKSSFRYARAKTIAVQGMESDAKLQYYNQIKALHLKATTLQISVIDYRNQLLVFDNHELLRKAFDMGEISLVEYLIELSIYYESINNLMEMEKNLNRAYAELNQYM